MTPIRRSFPLVTFVLVATFYFAESRALGALLISFDFQDFSGPVVSGSPATVSNSGTVGASANGTVSAFSTGSATSTSGPAGAGDVALEFNDTNGPGGVTALGAQVAFDSPPITGDYSYAFSVRPDGSQEQFDRVFEADGVVSPIFFDASPSFALRLGVNDRRQNFALAVDTWQHVALTYDEDGGSGSDGIVRVYINGVEQSFANNQFVDTGNDDLVTTPGGATLYLGSQSNGNRPFNGALDNLVIYDEFLGDSEVAALYSSTLSAIPEPSTGAWFAIVFGAALFRRKRRYRSA